MPKTIHATPLIVNLILVPEPLVESVVFGIKLANSFFGHHDHCVAAFCQLHPAKTKTAHLIISEGKHKSKHSCFNPKFYKRFAVVMETRVWGETAPHVARCARFPISAHRHNIKEKSQVHVLREEKQFVDWTSRKTDLPVKFVYLFVVVRQTTGFCLLLVSVEMLPHWPHRARLSPHHRFAVNKKFSAWNKILLGVISAQYLPVVGCACVAVVATSNTNDVPQFFQTGFRFGFVIFLFPPPPC